jgi:hypothetical protein
MEMAFVVHFFDWYKASSKADPKRMEKGWTYRVRWEEMGINPSEIGKTANYYLHQWNMIKDAGFDGISWEWHGNNPSSHCLEALKKADLKVMMFYDMEQSFYPQKDFIKPTEGFARTLVKAVASFYKSIPRDLWLILQDGSVPIIFYGYQFDRSSEFYIGDWDKFYSMLIQEIYESLKAPPKIFWTDSKVPQQLYAFQHFSNISPFATTPTHYQAPINARSHSFVLNYDDLGSFKMGKERRLIVNDIRYIQEMLWLAKHTPSELIFFNSWNGFPEGSNIIPDETYGDWRYRLASAIINEIKGYHQEDLPKALIIADDILLALEEGDSVTRDRVMKEIEMLYKLRWLVPHSDTVISNHFDTRIVGSYDMIIAANMIESFGENLFLGDILKEKTVIRMGLTSEGWIPKDLSSIDKGKFYPFVFKSDNLWVITRFEPDDRIYEAVFSEILGRPLNKGVLFSINGKVVEGDEVRIEVDERPMGIEEEELPIDDFLFVGSKEYSKPEVFTMPRITGDVEAEYVGQKEKRFDLARARRTEKFVLNSEEKLLIRRKVEGE